MCIAFGFKIYPNRSVFRHVDISYFLLLGNCFVCREQMCAKSAQKGLGASGTVYWRKSVYDDFADVQVDATQFRAYTSLAFPRWAP